MAKFLFLKKNYFIMVRILNMRCNLFSFLSVQYVIVDYRHNAVQQISRPYSFCLSETLCLLISNSPCLPSPSLATTISHFDSINLIILDTSFANFVSFGCFPLPKTPFPLLSSGKLPLTLQGSDHMSSLL